MSDAQYPSQCKLLKCTITTSDGSNPKLLGTDMILGFQWQENLMSPFCGGSMTISDSKNFITSYPIKGGENLKFEVETVWEEEPIVFELKCFSVSGRLLNGKTQVYQMNLISEEALINETIKVQSRLDGDPQAIIGTLLEKYIKTTKEYFAEPSRFKIKYNPAQKRPFDIIAKLTKQFVSAKTNFGDPTTSTTEDTEETKEEIKGSAGCFFWESRRGYNCFSVDALCDVEGGTFATPELNSETWGPYVEQIANTDQAGDSRFNVIGFQVSGEVNIMHSLRKGQYSQLMVFFNHSTGKYSEYLYKVKESYGEMSHLGGQDAVSLVPTNGEELTNKYSRISSRILDHESWFNDISIADPEDPNAENPTEYADWVKYYAAQSTTRYNLLTNQEAVLKIPGNPYICAGDKIEIMLQSKSSDEERKEEPFDKETSGIYLVKEATHAFNFLDGTSGFVNTTLRLFRDSYGSKVEPSEHGN